MAPYLGIELEGAFAGTTGVDGELGRSIHDAAGGLQPRPEGLHLWVGVRVDGVGVRVVVAHSAPMEREVGVRLQRGGKAAHGGVGLQRWGAAPMGAGGAHRVCAWGQGTAGATRRWLQDRGREGCSGAQ